MTEVQVNRRLSLEAAEGVKYGVDRQVEALAKSFGISQAAQMWLSGTDMPDTRDSKPTKPYSQVALVYTCLLYTSPSPRDRTRSRMPSSA